jgi:hypothetical protein
MCPGKCAHRQLPFSPQILPAFSFAIFKKNHAFLAHQTRWRKVALSGHRQSFPMEEINVVSIAQSCDRAINLQNGFSLSALHSATSNGLPSFTSRNHIESRFGCRKLG